MCRQCSYNSALSLDTQMGKTINVSCGLKAKGRPIGASGLSKLYEVVNQLRGTTVTCVIYILEKRLRRRHGP